ncbi:uncharacterized protein CTRU02_203270 [Colletotrichum truncatum]|uniref:Uncharacterized protein n=1 Tax=Colletotrichum truncatum TaxID=5467 RepID=A0ACC3Z8X5_COLTU|nr:uncharacterized protein CTRU02_09112 [Colletotrichum truncatum]KAF6789320.1 hypothetical protein CTRU02_09112 [Colletotrichum truncatum]
MEVSNARPLAIFTGYMVLAAALTAKSFAIIRSQRKRNASSPPQDGSAGSSARRRAISVFSLLAALSLATTWYHMFRFFEWSYDQWAITHPVVAATTENPEGLRLGEWLRDTSLFKQAWASTLETGPRAWWSLQIFGFCANWSVLLAVQARKRHIPHAWIFVLLGQVVAISFATNLSFLAILCSDVLGEKVSKEAKAESVRKDKGVTPSSVSAHSVILVVTLLWATSIPSAIGKPGFLLLLLGPHLLAFFPLILNKLLPSKVLSEPARFWTVASMVWVLAVAFKGVVDESESLNIVIRTLYEHPAVSSVGWDVICCWITFAAWFFIGVA